MCGSPASETTVADKLITFGTEVSVYTGSLASEMVDWSKRADKSEINKAFFFTIVVPNSQDIHPSSLALPLLLHVDTH
jgi:hypothetical protein